MQSSVRWMSGIMAGALPRFSELLESDIPQRFGVVRVLRTLLWLDLVAVCEVHA